MKLQQEVVDLFSEVKAELIEVERQLERFADSSDPILREASLHLLKAGGKRLRPALLLLSSKFSGRETARLIPLGAAVEMLHTATLIHDDVVDGAATRRGIPSVNAKWSDRVSVLAGDYLFAKAFSVFAEFGGDEVVKIMADVVYEMCTGEIEQISWAHKEVAEEEYLERIGRKTAYFIAKCCHVGALVSSTREDWCQGLCSYGYNLGLAFQIVDDILDFTGNPLVLGKPLCGDIREGIVTLPVIYAMEDDACRRQVRQLIGKKEITAQEAEGVVRLLKRTGAFQRSFQFAKKCVSEAKFNISSLPDTSAKAMLNRIADFVIARGY